MTFLTARAVCILLGVIFCLHIIGAFLQERFARLCAFIALALHPFLFWLLLSAHCPLSECTFLLLADTLVYLAPRALMRIRRTPGAHAPHADGASAYEGKGGNAL